MMHVIFVLANLAWIIGVIWAAVWLTLRQHRGETLRAASSMREGREASLPGDAPGVADSEPFDQACSNAAAINDPASPAPLLRFPYRLHQWAAPYTDGRNPAVGDFVSVECYELYKGGVSFYSRVPFDSDLLIVSLGKPASMFFMSSRVINRLAIRDRGSTKYLLECQFVRRVQIDTWRWVQALGSPGARDFAASH